MAYDTDNLKNAKPGMTVETSDKTVPGAGLYRHPNGTEIITMYDPVHGDTQSEAAVRLGFEYVRPVAPSEIHTIVNTAPVATTAVSQAEEDRNRLDQLELAELRREKKEREAADAEAQEALKAASTDVETIEDAKTTTNTKKESK